MHIGLDLDEVVCNLFDGMRETAMPNLPFIGLNANFTNVDWQIENGFNKAVDLVRDVDFLKKMPFDPEAKFYVNKLKDYGHDISFITKRPAGEDWITEQWLEKHNIKFDDVVHVSYDGGIKGPVARDLKIDWFIEDTVGNLDNVKEYGINNLLVRNREWNIGTHNYAWFESWEYVLYCVEKLKGIKF